MTSQLLRFRSLFLSCQQQKNNKNGAAVTSLRSFLFRDNFSQTIDDTHWALKLFPFIDVIIYYILYVLRINFVQQPFFLSNRDSLRIILHWFLRNMDLWFPKPIPRLLLLTVKFFLTWNLLWARKRISTLWRTLVKILVSKWWLLFLHFVLY